MKCCDQLSTGIEIYARVCKYCNRAFGRWGNSCNSEFSSMFISCPFAQMHYKKALLFDAVFLKPIRILEDIEISE